MTVESMRKLSLASPSFLRWYRLLLRRSALPSLRQILPTRSLAQVRTEPFSDLWFTPSSPRRGPADDLLNGFPGNGSDHKPADERTLRLGKTLRTLSPLLPSILSHPQSLPPEIISPSVSLHLFPSTHPHLPAVKGKVPYRAALWTAPVAWGCVPIVGNVKLTILSEKIVRTGFVSTPHEDDKPDLGEEKLVVRWKTESKKGNGNADSGLSSSSAVGSTNTTTTTSSSAQPSPNPASPSTSPNDGTPINRGLSSLFGGSAPILSPSSSFSGIFIFSFDSQGRIATHTIEHAEEGNGFDKTSKVVTLTDWLLGKAKWGRGREEELVPGLAMRICREEWGRGRRMGFGQ